MQSSIRNVSGWVGLVGAAGALMSVLTLVGCSGAIDPAVVKGGTGGSSTGTGGSGSSSTGGATGTGGMALNCTGGNDGVSIVMVNCATTFCHIPGAANDGTAGGLDLTVDANIGARLVGVTSVGTSDNGSMCMGNSTPYLNAGSNPATGLLIDKVSMANPPCGAQMPFDSPFPLSTMQRNCLVQWATTLTSP
jgi:hypothetical protein